MEISKDGVLSFIHENIPFAELLTNGIEPVEQVTVTNNDSSEHMMSTIDLVWILFYRIFVFLLIVLNDAYTFISSMLGHIMVTVMICLILFKIMTRKGRPAVNNSTINSITNNFNMQTIQNTNTKQFSSFPATNNPSELYKPEIYSPDKDIIDWLESFERYVFNIDEQYWKDELEQLLDEKSKTEIELSLQDKSNSYSDIKRHLRLAFNKKNTSKDALKNFVTRTQLKDESLYEFAKNLQSLARKTKLPTELANQKIIDLFIEGISSNSVKRALKRIYAMDKPKKLTEVVETAQQFEDDSIKSRDSCNSKRYRNNKYRKRESSDSSDSTRKYYNQNRQSKFNSINYNNTVETQDHDNNQQYNNNQTQNNNSGNSYDQNNQNNSSNNCNSYDSERISLLKQLKSPQIQEKLLNLNSSKIYQESDIDNNLSGLIIPIHQTPEEPLIETPQEYNVSNEIVEPRKIDEDIVKSTEIVNHLIMKRAPAEVINLPNSNLKKSLVEDQKYYDQTETNITIRDSPVTATKLNINITRNRPYLAPSEKVLSKIKLIHQSTYQPIRIGALESLIRVEDDLYKLIQLQLKANLVNIRSKARKFSIVKSTESTATSNENNVIVNDSTENIDTLSTTSSQIIINEVTNTPSVTITENDNHINVSTEDKEFKNTIPIDASLFNSFVHDNDQYEIQYARKPKFRKNQEIVTMKHKNAGFKQTINDCFVVTVTKTIDIFMYLKYVIL